MGSASLIIQGEKERTLCVSYIDSMAIKHIIRNHSVHSNGTMEKVKHDGSLLSITCV